MVDNGRPYIVPLNFGYSYERDTLELYFHCALKGRKIDLLKVNPNVCIEMDCDYQLVESEIACKNGALYASIIGEGRATFIEDIEVKKQALSKLMAHATGKAFEFTDPMVKAVGVFKITVDVLTAKARRA